MAGSWPYVAVAVVLVYHNFPSLRYMYILLNLPHDILISVWTDWFMISCCNGRGVGLPSFPVSPIYTLLMSLMMSSYSSFYDNVLYVLIYRFTHNIFPSWKRWVELQLLRAGHRRKGSTRSERRRRKHALGWYGRDCCIGIWRSLPAVLKTLENDSDDITPLWAQGIYRYQVCTTVYTIDNAGRHDFDFGREGLINALSFFSYYM